MADTTRNSQATTRKGPASTRTPARPRGLDVPRWLPITSLVLSLAGLGVSIYMTYEHYTGNKTLACSANSFVNCAAVTTSPQSYVFKWLADIFDSSSRGIPVAVTGLPFFVVMVALCLPAVWRMRAPIIRYGRILFAAIGVIFVFYLAYQELATIKRLCEYCTIVHILTLALFCVILFGTASLDTEE